MMKKRCFGLESNDTNDEDGKTDTIRVEFIRLDGKSFKRKKTLSTSDVKQIFSQALKLQETLFQSKMKS
jgi:hypothetical protein